VVLGIILVIAFIYWHLPKPYGAKYFFRGPKRFDDEEEEEEGNLLGKIRKDN
jgi:hypothetical protein